MKIFVLSKVANAAKQQPILLLHLIGLLVLCTHIELSNANVINDMNNMLRDATSPVSNESSIRQRNILRNAAKDAAPQVKEMDSKLQDLISTENKSSDEEDEFEDIAEETSAELLRFVDDVEMNDGNNENYHRNKHSMSTSTTTTGKPNDKSSALEEQVRLLTKQLNALTMRRREDYELLERNLRKSLKITTNAVSVDNDIRNQLDQLRREVQSLNDGHINGNKERLTVEWLQQSVAEIRKQLVELQHIASSTAKDITHRTQSYEDLATIRSDFTQVKVELTALKERQQQSEIYIRELREELLQQEEQYRHFIHLKNNILHTKENANIVAISNNDGTELNTELEANHNRRHCRFQRQQIHELQLAQHAFKRQLNELKYHRIGERVRNIEIEQHRIADANFNLSRQIASLDKLHSSMLELLEDVEGIQNKMDKSVPELRHEISKLEFTNAQLTSEQSLVREEGKNVARSVQAMAVSVSTLQDERDGVKQMQSTVTQLQTNVDRLQSMVQDIQRALIHRKNNAESKSSLAEPTKAEHASNKEISAEQTAATSLRAETLVAKLERVEEQYESIINKLPADCSEVSTNSSMKIDGLYLIAPAGQHHPLMTHCTNDGWTTVQRRYDGSADFNRSWVDYADGFGTPSGEFWIGNEQLHHLTLNNCSSLRVLMQDIYDNVWLAEYGYFYISSRSDGYRLHVGDYSGNASDALDYQQDMQFSAIDVDRDISQTHCAANYEGGWWFSHCQHANLNGRYNLGLTWFDAGRNEWIAVKSSHMLVKTRNNNSCWNRVTGTERVDPQEIELAPATSKTTAGKLIIINADMSEVNSTTDKSLH